MLARSCRILHIYDLANLNFVNRKSKIVNQKLPFRIFV